MFKFIPPTEII